MTLTYDPDAGLAPLEFSVSKNLNAKNDAERAELLAHLTAVVLDEAEPSDEDVLLLGVLQHLNLARRLLPGAHERYDRREMVRRIETLTREDLLVQAVRRAVGGTCGTITAAAAGSVA